MTLPASPSPYFWLSLTGAVGLAMLFGLFLPTLFVRIVREVSWAKMGRSAMLMGCFWLFAVGAAWAFDAYCQWFNLTRELSVMLFLWFLMLAVGTYYGFRNYHRLNRVTSRSELEREQRLLRVVQEVSRGGFFISRPSSLDPGQWLVESANRAACMALGYEYRTTFDNELIGLTGAQIVSPVGLEKARKHAAIADKTEYLLQLVCKDGRVQWVEMAGQTIANYHDGPVRVSYFNVVTQLIERIEDQRDKLLLANAVQELNQHVKRLTHEPA